MFNQYEMNVIIYFIIVFIYSCSYRVEQVITTVRVDLVEVDWFVSYAWGDTMTLMNSMYSSLFNN